MPSSALLFVPLLAGFIFLRLCHRTRYISRSWESTRLIFSVGVAGLILVTLTRVSIAIFRPWASWHASLVHNVFPDPYSGTLVGTVLLSLFGAFVANCVWPPNEAAEKTRNSGDSLHLLLAEQVDEELLVAFTLADGKVYIGWIPRTPTLDPRERYVVISPVLSGYRDEKKSIQIMTDYVPVYRMIENKELEGLTYEHLEVLVARDQIVSAHLFDIDLFKDVFKGTLPEPGRGRIAPTERAAPTD